MTELMKHGHVLNMRLRTDHLYDDQGDVIGAETYSVTQMWCTRCQRAITVRGVVGVLEFKAVHDPGDCAKKGA